MIVILLIEKRRNSIYDCHPADWKKGGAVCVIVILLTGKKAEQYI